MRTHTSRLSYRNTQRALMVLPSFHTSIHHRRTQLLEAAEVQKEEEVGEEVVSKRSRRPPRGGVTGRGLLVLVIQAPGRMVGRRKKRERQNEKKEKTPRLLELWSLTNSSMPSLSQLLTISSMPNASMPSLSQLLSISSMPNSSMPCSSVEALVALSLSASYLK